MRVVGCAGFPTVNLFSGVYNESSSLTQAGSRASRPAEREPAARLLSRSTGRRSQLDRSCNGVAVATVKRGGGGDAPHCVLSRCVSIINGTACCLPAVLPRTLDANLLGAACGASLWAAECGMHVIWPCGGVRPREMRVEGHGSPRAINKCALLLCCFRSFLLVYRIHRPQFQSARPPLSTTPYACAVCVRH